ncbi:unnamed protein product [Rotaria socialis]|uniref:Uncharacterized protein n=1 Tax=Rotaria socialis TaxID=392032 RepID=A0A820YPL6_9BILA|nr:unnamed protein product [Rotaria socialis]CAF4545853.1 unnamed protein product [Rotaria socialis]CAF4596454.1 unnamed protein product [Rotaria socialis]
MSTIFERLDQLISLNVSSAAIGPVPVQEQCAAFFRSSWAKQCEVMQIIINHRSSIDDLINVVANIQVTKAIFQPGERRNYFPSR